MGPIGPIGQPGPPVSPAIHFCPWFAPFFGLNLHFPILYSVLYERIIGTLTLHLYYTLYDLRLP